MKTLPHKTERIHSLDSLRAIMMLLGLVIHSALTYGVVDYGSGWSLKDTGATHLSNDYIASFVHAFRMQIFFVVAGFFGALLFYERLPLKMVKNRISRIVLPFLVFVLLLWPTIVFAFGYTKFVFAGSTDALAETLGRFSSWEILIPGSTFHLWFLYYLALITFFSVGVALVFKKLPGVTSQISSGFNWIIQKPVVRILVFAALTAVIYMIMGSYSVATSNSFIPDFNTFIYYTSFYFVGWILFKSKHLLETFMKFDWLTTVLGILLFSVYFFMNDSLSFEAKLIMKSVLVWLLIFGVTGLFIRYGSNHSARMRYVSDASYWVYLLHLSFTAIIPGLIADWPLPPTLKFLFVLITTGVICFVSYHYLVRGTFIGQFLNGRKYSKKLSDIKQAEVSIPLEPALDN
jgi:hypothetical protein